MSKPSKLFLKYSNIIKRGFMTEREIISFRSAVGSFKTTSLSEAEQDELVDMVDQFIKERGEIHLEQSQKYKGIDWLKRKLFKSNGQLRNDQFVKNTYLVEEVARIVRNFHDFTLVGFDDFGANSFHNFRQLMPVYRCYAKDGTFFDYVGRASINLDVIRVKNW